MQRITDFENQMDSVSEIFFSKDATGLHFYEMGMTVFCILIDLFFSTDLQYPIECISNRKGI